MEVEDSSPPIELPPVIANIQQTLEAYISTPERLRIHQFFNNLKLFGTFPSRRDIQPLLNFQESPIPLVQQVRRDPKTGKIVNYEEVETTACGECAKNSFSLTRALGPRSEFLRGNSTNYPFWPGGFSQDADETISTQMGKLSVMDNCDELENGDENAIFHELFNKEMLTCPPGLESGVDFDHEKVNISNAKTKLDQLNTTALSFWGSQSSQEKSKFEIELQKISEAKLAQSENKFKRLFKGLVHENITIPDEQEAEEVAKPIPILRIGKMAHHPKSATKLQWSEMIDMSIPISEEEFKEKVPDMAKKYEFDLDQFQKQAVIKLEEHENVFVAAHTSAGKTVVAEYAIALSKRHMTRTIYTSPIKALSNQKFRDFRDIKLHPEFEGLTVGLVTGDVQINPSGSCLIMTAEILRSMLYNGSDVIRDLEWVVFDEIHYLNNEERGHVWEEVLIMLPQHVSIIMLSATVPNALQFANWVGEIKRKKIYVISTLKRPVPLKHHLYTGSGGRSKDELFQIMDNDGHFFEQGYAAAKQAKEARKSNHSKQFGARGRDQQRQQAFNPDQEKNTYIGLIEHLRKNQNLPAVIFTFSRNRCDTYAEMLMNCSLDLFAKDKNGNGKENEEEDTHKIRGSIHGFFQKSIAKLKGSDCDLPQVIKVREMLKNGIGVHHSGILPILKEIVELLFQAGKVKILFATETFAMGVNMPARTVVFDSCRKHDGTCFRMLNAAEYIQMAGRAGRRGKDPLGTVIILCKAGVPDFQKLKNMLTGSAAKLQSQFRLTYSMILNLLRVENLSVEDVMKRSFLEAGKSKNLEKYKENKNKVIEKLELLENQPRDGHLLELSMKIKDYLQMRKSIMDSLVVMPQLANMLAPGRCILFEQYPKNKPRFGIILSSFAIKDAYSVIRKKYEVITLADPDEEKTTDLITFSEDYSKDNPSSELINRMYNLYCYYANPYCPKLVPQLYHIERFDARESYPYHKIVEIFSENILEICKRGPVRADDKAVKEDVKKRQMERFRFDKPVPNVLALLQELYTMTAQEVKRDPHPVEYIYFGKLDIAFKDAMQLLSFKRYLDAEAAVKNWKLPLSEDFTEQFRPIFEYLRLLVAKEEYDYLLSPQSLQLYEDYEARINVLKKLGYIDNECLVLMKGRVACEMGNQNELLVTEMILNNILSDCPPEEIAALLSCMVFEAKNVPEPEEIPNTHLAEKVDEVKTTAKEIAEAQRSCGLKEPVQQYVEQFKFGLVEVVYQWAKGEEFCNIMNLTDVQEGIIVRTIQRLDELIRDVKDAARIIGDPTLKKKMEEASECIKRDIVFAASLYTEKITG